MVKMKQSATMAYRPQVNGKAERTVQMLTRALKMYFTDVYQQDWDDYPERLTFSLNTAQDRVRGDTSFYLVHGWDPRSTLEATIPLGSTRRRECEPRWWRYHIQRQYQRAKEVLNEQLRQAMRVRSDRHNENARPHRIKEGIQVWLYLDRVKEGAHAVWPFRVNEVIGDYAARLEVAGTGHRISPIVHLSKLKSVRTFPDRPKTMLTTDEADRVDFNEAFLPEDSWERPLDADEYEVEEIVDVRTGRRTHCERVHREFKVRWKGYDESTWVDEADLSCGALLQEFERKITGRNRFQVMQSQEEE
ncbi:Reverse transcriptase [Phytophthora palmivora]|uniref:Reverse transcriptase n=1 Tax=Phytophthora palmivora TaxID=4796 RepID=A0A2P4XZN9_9STRA|nr:Reverse transcriptase [Phytophthora palmivora]